MHSHDKMNEKTLKSMYVIFYVCCSKLVCASFRKIQIYATLYKPPSEILCVLFYPGIQIFVLLSLSSVHQWCHFLNVLFEATKVNMLTLADLRPFKV